ncbi:putative amidohydrolase [Actinoplanes lutulentus]|uniref:Putative amidohydrolase n=1 Tax=Actinoplanes lutulentus TaxID=1287878 RepID=A0A327ZI26_9ACTN|nr:nitrilase-related carbon-nitrogen hydrolase [Actinoplanes lutulentus]MBB2944405.1 putative amidohydrolase [Actinoplanes lutulentus]RAK42363.1 putative amidohydrolase [Actinoplanes lutulentus]
MPGVVRVAAAQIEAGQDIAANLAACLRVIDAAAEQKAQLVVLPEFCNHLSWYASRAQAHELATRLEDEFLTAIAERARRHGMWVKVNVTHAYPDGRTGGTNFLFDAAGEIVGSCDKQTLMGAENDFLEPAPAVGPVLDTPLGRLGMYACMEGVINEVARGLALRGAQVLLNSLNSFALDEADLHIPVRAAENKVWVVAANKVGPLLPREDLPAIAERLGVPPEWLHGAGESQIVAPDGTVVAKAPRTGEAVVVADIDVSLADDKSRPDGTDILASRRPSLYGAIAAEPVGRQRPAGAPTLPVAVVRDIGKIRDAVDAGARLVVLPELAGTPDEIAESLKGTTAHAVTTVLDEGVPTGVLISENGLVARQPQLHTAKAAGKEIVPIDLEWGRLAIVVGDDALYPETFRLAALLDTDVVAVPLSVQEPWELELGLPERAAENRLNVVVATPLDQPAAIFAMTPDFTLWTKWEGPFTGRISTPIRTDIAAGEAVAVGTVNPAQAANRQVSRNTDLVDGRPWRLVSALL